MPYYSLLCLILTLANALTLDTPSTAWEVGDNTTVNWSSTSEDPSTFALQLYEIYYNQLYTVSDDVATSLGSLTFPVPVVSQGSAWTLRAVNASDTTQAPYAQSGVFGIWAI
ncbi:hypothetical protein FOMPIDRAFT_93861 [Fomitopsis schrenkii]|uniref:Yeast cell wall synthesis Kre9/Knh1-like N-terminal domain-containing protein n=1 Tax=Fomitopsis schrenkii TaxID=2126942 RepID=S8E106_FOMSC|nr:hypothetical protein FOMPIDRAFT_93861 [Fomitopsis schrenkii]